MKPQGSFENPTRKLSVPRNSTDTVKIANFVMLNIFAGQWHCAVKPKCCEPPFSLLAYPKAHFLMFLWFFNIDTPKNVIKKFEIGPTGVFLCCDRYLFCKKYIFSKKKTKIRQNSENAIFLRLWFFSK